MPNKTAAKKALRQSIKRQAANKIVQTNLKWLYKKCRDLIKEGKKSEAMEIALKFQKASDKAAKNNIISKNAVNRKKGSLITAINKMTA